jgi:DNA polymerase alpha subunit B
MFWTSEWFLTCFSPPRQAHEGRINQTSVLLEGDRHSTGGKRVNVDLSELKSSKTSFSLFPGQIVAVEGMNVSGRKIVAHRICEGSAKKPTKTTVEELLHLHHDVQDGKPLKLMSVCGPYTASDNLEYEPLDDLLAVISAEKPDVVILAGPFVDMRHPAVLSGETVLQGDDGSKQYVAYETFFAIKIAALLEQYFGGDEDAMVDDTGSTDVRTQFVLVPSLDDAVAEWV